MTKKDEKKQSFLHEAQKFGKADGKIEITDLDKAIADIHKITIPEAAEMLRNEEDIPSKKLTIYCHDCRKIVSPEIKQVRRKHRKVCGECGSVKISAGSKEALEKFYHIEGMGDKKK